MSIRPSASSAARPTSTPSKMVRVIRRCSMTSAIASSSRAALRRDSCAWDFHISAVSATAAEEMIAIIVIWEIRETPSRVRPNCRNVGADVDQSHHHAW